MVPDAKRRILHKHGIRERGKFSHHFNGEAGTFESETIFAMLSHKAIKVRVGAINRSKTIDDTG